MTQAVERSAETAAEDDPPVARSRWGRRLRLAGIVAMLVLFAVELVVGWSSLAGALRQLRAPHVGWLALATLAEVAAMGAYARMQGRLLRSAGVRASHLDNVKLTYAAHSLNETLPGGAAFSTRLNYQQMRRFGASPAIASWTIALSGILSACALAAVTVGSALAAGGGADWSHLAALLVATILLILGARRVAKHPESAETLIRTPLAAVNRLRRRPATHGQDGIRDFLQQLRAARLRPTHGAAAAILAVANWFLDAVCLWLCFRAVGEQPAGLTAVLLAFCAAMAAGTITIVPGGLGIIDSALILGLMAGGVTTPAAVATVVLYRIISFGFIIGLGWLSWLHIRRTTHQAPLPLTAPPTVPALTAPAIPAIPAFALGAATEASAVALFPTAASTALVPNARSPRKAENPAAHRLRASGRRLARSPKTNSAKATTSFAPEGNAAKATASLRPEQNAARADAPRQRRATGAEVAGAPCP
ncbi:flippase-like domain-containing protein [Actinoplanes sp. NPDC048988]|uniref:lysylphosphatidylglycerol synthase transmembrane domain-containing protein n=1 Tax=Actinoplanes sp. NPDC048988 TaxID=3363901 RepID=UPI0037135FE8